MHTGSRDPADAPRGLSTASAAVVALAHTPAASVGIFLWLMAMHTGRIEPMREHVVLLLPVAGATVLLSGKALKVREDPAPYWHSALVACATVFGTAIALENIERFPGWVTFLLFVLPVPLVFAALTIGAHNPIGRLRLPTSWAAMAAMLLLVDGAMRYPQAQEEQLDATTALMSYDAVAVLDAPGWTLTHAYDRSVFPELVYRDPLGRTVLLGSTPGPLTEEDEHGEYLAADVPDPEHCTPGPWEMLRVLHCEVRDGVLVVEMEGATPDRLMADDNDRWPSGWTEARIETSDGRYVRLRTAAPAVDLVDLAGSIEGARPTDPEANVAEASCLLRCPVWRNYHP
ncbi:hypothetical protein IDM40_17315 [Nocardiopsis sp. HNM0947]|uniref:Uncharacterized protein n=1 Tax=Nocardiopsis coralli TaxID=2772213 RepID=A0ABR9P9C4_9ACTN|nr:hypothetical protein [Nocardiopsis coralli]MBE3000446.1 hypothetical protein [Nocardiopsis coralli]